MSYRIQYRNIESKELLQPGDEYQSRYTSMTWSIIGSHNHGCKRNTLSSLSVRRPVRIYVGDVLHYIHLPQSRIADGDKFTYNLTREKGWVGVPTTPHGGIWIGLTVEDVRSRVSKNNDELFFRRLATMPLTAIFDAMEADCTCDITYLAAIGHKPDCSYKRKR